MKKTSRRRDTPAPSGYWIYGVHPVMAALANPNREVHELLVTANAASRLDATMTKQFASITRASEASYIAQKVGGDGVHQGIAARVSTLPEASLEVLLFNKPTAPILILDQVTDPHNVGAILRSAAAFDAAAVILPSHGSPQEGAVMAKSACGALDITPLIYVINLSQAMESLKANGYWCVGLDGHTDNDIRTALPKGAPLALVLGAEGKGMRPKTRDYCDVVVKLPISEKMESLNVSNAAAIALYEVSRG